MSGANPSLASVERVVRQFEDATIVPGEFDHESHIQVGWWYVRQYALPEAIGRFTTAIRRLTEALGVPGKYHETLSWFYLIVIADRVRDPDGTDWPAFKAAQAP